MKKFLFFLVLTLFCFISFSQENNLETISKIRTEQEIAERLEKLLEPITGKIIVSVDLQLQYPKLNFAESQIIPEKSEKPSSSRRKAAIASLKKRKELSSSLETKIISKKITVYVPKNIDFEAENLVRSSIKEWLKIDVGKGDRIFIKKNLPALSAAKPAAEEKKSIGETSATEQVQTVTPFLNSQLIVLIVIGVLFIILLIILGSNFRKGLEKLASTLREVGENFQPSSAPVPQLASAKSSAETSILEESRRKPLQIQILPEEEQKTENNDFSFLENLSPQSFKKFISDEKPDNIAFIFSAISPEYAQKFIDIFPDSFEQILKAFSSHPKKTRSEIENLRKKLLEKYEEFLKNEKIELNEAEILANLINMLPYDKSSEFFDNLKSFDIDLAAAIKDKILLLEDLIKLDDDIIKGIIFNLNHNQLALFLASVEDDIREKFFRNMSTRSQEILKEDVDNLGELSAAEKSDAVNDVLKTIRSLLNYI